MVERASMLSVSQAVSQKPASLTCEMIGEIRLSVTLLRFIVEADAARVSLWKARFHHDTTKAIDIRHVRASSEGMVGHVHGEIDVKFSVRPVKHSCPFGDFGAILE